MSQVDLNLRIVAPTDPTFSYFGSDLELPLRSLLQFLTDDIAKIESDLADAQKKAVADKGAPKNSALAVGEAEKNLRVVERRLHRALNEKVDAELWLQEARRMPERLWTLTMKQLRTLYPQKIDPRLYGKGEP